MVGNHRAVHFNPSDGVVSQTDGGLGMMKGSVCIAFPDCPELTTLLPVSCFLFDCLGEAVNTSLACL